MISVLYVDDEQALLEIARLFLEETGGFRVGTAISARDALKDDTIRSYDAIVSDYQMPGMDGIEFLKIVRERYGDIPFILFTGRGREEVVIEAINNGADFYLQKGGDPKAQFAELEHKIRQSVRRKQAEHSFRDSERRLADIIDFLPDATFAIDRAGRVIAWNRSIEDMTGIPAADMLGKGDYEYAIPFYGERRPTLIDLIDKPDDAISEYYTNVYRSGSSLTAETAHSHPRGHRVIVLAKACNLYNQAGEITGAIESIRDVTGQKRMESDLASKHVELQASYEQLAAAEEEMREQYEELAKSEQRFRNLIQNSSDMVRIIGPDGLITYSSPSTLRLFGYDPADVIGTNPRDYIHPDDKARVQDALSEVFGKSNTGIPTEFRIRHRDGHYIDVEAVASNQVDTPGINGIVVTTRPITERKQAEAALEERESRLRRLADNAPDMIYRMSLPDGKYEYVSPAAAAITGYAPEEFYDEPCLVSRLIHPAWQEYFQQEWDALLRNQAPPSYEFQIVDKAGRTRWINQRNIPVTGPEGGIVAIEGIVTDITRQKDTERELHRSELRALAVIENIGEWIWEVDPEGIYRYSSPAVTRMLGYRPDELVGKMHFYDLFDPPVRDSLKAAALAAFARREPFRDSVNIARHRNGTPVLIRTSMIPVFDDEGTFAGYCGVDEDITERNTAQSALQAMVKSMVGTTGIDSLRKITGNVSSWLQADCVMVGEIQPDLRTVNVLAMRLDGKDVEGFAYALKGTPCENAAEKGYCIYTDNVRQAFPDAKDLADLAIRGYVGSSLRNSEGNVIGILCAMSRNPLRPARPVQEIMDILAVKAAAEIERARIEQDLLLSRQQLAEAMDLAVLVNWEYDVDEDLFTFDNRFYALYGTTAEREGGTRMSSERYASGFVHPDDRGMVAEEIQKALKTADPRYVSSLEHRIIRRDGEIRYISVRIAIAKCEGGRVIRTRGANQDISDRKQAEESLRLAHKKLHLLTGITRHDIGNQLMALNGFVSLLHNKVTDPALESYFSRISEASRQITAMIAFTKEYDKIGEHAPVWRVLATVVDDAAKGILPGQVLLKNDLPPTLEVIADPLIVKAFFNLLDNSIRHGQRVTEITVSSRMSGENLVVVWEDNGIGIVRDEKERIFERGFGKNTGLGMFLVKEILSLTGITIAETGEPLAGARFEMVVPRGAYRFMSR
jgi:PAS domain S-box-containing protein